MAGVNWLRWELGTVVAFHAGLAVVILAAPDHLVVTSATWAIFAYLHRIGMGVMFAVTAVCAAACLWQPRPLVQLATWVLVYMLGLGWLTGFILALRHGDGGLYGVVIWTVMLAGWISTAVRLGLGNGGTGVAGHLSSGRRIRQ